MSLTKVSRGGPGDWKHSMCSLWVWADLQLEVLCNLVSTVPQVSQIEQSVQLQQDREGGRFSRPWAVPLDVCRLPIG